MRYQIEYKDKKTKYGFIGMNKFAALAHKILYKHKHPEHVLEIYGKVPKKVRLHTIRHEMAEEYFMKNKKYPYKKAHKLALKFEELNKPFPKTNIKRKLKEMGFEY